MLVQKNTTIIAIATIAVLIAASFLPMVCESVSDGDSSTVSDENEKKEYKYISLGDSMTDGYGLFGYYFTNEYVSNLNLSGFLMDVEATYPHMLTEYLKEQMPDTEVTHVPLAISASRTTELRCLLYDDFTGSDSLPGDGYSSYYFNGWLASTYAYPVAELYYGNYGYDSSTAEGKFHIMQNVYRQELSDVDLVTLNYHLDFGAGILSSYLGSYFQMDTDFGLYADSETIEKIQTLKANIEEYIINLAIGLGADISSIVDMVDKLATGFAYAVIGYCENIDAICDWIYEHNPDAKIVIVEPYNVFNGMKIKVSDELTFDFSSVYQMALDLADTYVKYLSPYSLSNYFVDIDYVPTTMAQEFRNYEDGTVITDAVKADAIYAVSYATGSTYGLPAQKDFVPAYDYFNVNHNLDLLLKYVFEANTLSMVDILGGTEVAKSADAKFVQAIGIINKTDTTVTKDYEADTVTVYNAGTSTSITFTSAELIKKFGDLDSMCNFGLLTHPSPIGHIQIWATLKQAIEDQEVLSSESKICSVINNITDTVSEEISSILADIDSAVAKSIEYLYNLIKTFIESITTN